MSQDSPIAAGHRPGETCSRRERDGMLLVIRRLGEAGFEPARAKGSRDFKSLASAIPPLARMVCAYCVMCGGLLQSAAAAVARVGSPFFLPWRGGIEGGGMASGYLPRRVDTPRPPPLRRGEGRTWRNPTDAHRSHAHCNHAHSTQGHLAHAHHSCACQGHSVRGRALVPAVVADHSVA